MTPVFLPLIAPPAILKNTKAGNVVAKQKLTIIIKNGRHDEHRNGLA